MLFFRKLVRFLCNLGSNEAPLFARKALFDLIDIFVQACASKILRLLDRISHKKCIIYLVPIFIFAGGVNSGSVLLMNDAPFILSATIQGSDGTFLGQITLQPGQQRNFTQNLSPTNYDHPGAPDISLTPYTVIWQCSSDDYYSMCTNVAPGSLVRANECFGYRVCRPKKSVAKETPASTLEKKK